jgi:MAF protein
MSSGRPANVKLHLASNSPRRKELMALGWEYDVLTPQVDETPLPGENGVDYVRRLAQEKLVNAAAQTHADGVIVAADTTVVDPQPGGVDAILGKPGDQAEATHMLHRLRGRTHQVLTAIAILSTPESKTFSDLCITDVPMRNYSDEELQVYVASGDPLDKAGAYAIQHAGFHPVDKLEGCFANVMGLPLCHLTRNLRKLGIQPKADVPESCQTALGYHCPVYSLFLAE